MNTTLTIDKAGRVVLPKPVRDELQLSPGDSLELECSEEGITLRPSRANPRIYKKQGVWVMHAGSPLATEAVEKTIDRIRREREESFLGKRK